MRKCILFVCEGIQHLSATMTLARTVKDNGLTPLLFFTKQIPLKYDISLFESVTSDLFTIPGLLQKVGLVVFFTNESSPFCLPSIKIGHIAKKTNTPSVSIQHGWIQPGLNFNSGIRKVSYHGIGTDNSSATWHFTDVIEYSGDNGIGYPNDNSDPNTPFSVARKTKLRALIATNFNWGVYSREDVIAFLRCILLVKQQFPSFELIHRGHPAEGGTRIFEDIGFSLNDLGITIGSYSDIDEALDSVDMVISTPSTVVLDSYAKRVPAFVFNGSSFKSALQEYNNISFSKPSELKRLLARLTAHGEYAPAQFPRFSAESFLTQVKERMKESGNFVLKEEDYLQYITFAKL